MIPSDQRARDIIGHLADQLAGGWGAFLVAKHVHEARASKRIDCAHYLFSIAEESCVESAIMALSRILVFDRESINIQYLLSYAEQNPQVFRADTQTVRECVRQHRQQLGAVSSLVANIREQRDRTGAHLDRKHVTDPSAVYTHPPLDHAHVEATFGRLLNIINAYSGFLSPSMDIRFDRLETCIADDLNYLVGLIKRDNDHS